MMLSLQRSLLAFVLLTAVSCRPRPEAGPGAVAGASSAGGQHAIAPIPAGKLGADLARRLEGAAHLSGAQLLAARERPFVAKLSYDPSAAGGLERIRASSLAPSSAESAALKSRGFVISDGKRVPSFTHGYATIYGEHLPLYISADSILMAVHRSYDDALASLEDDVLQAEARALIGSLRERLKGSPPAGLRAEVRADLDLFLAVGLGLLDGNAPSPVAGANPAKIKALIDRATAATGTDTVTLFGADRELDFSQFSPRGHYAGRAEREKYFRALVWFGRTELKLLESGEDGVMRVVRPQIEAALALGELADPAALGRFARIDQTIGLFVGENEGVTLTGLGALKTVLGAPSLPALGAIDDATLLARLEASEIGRQRIASQILRGEGSSARPLPRVFQLLGQRYTLDSHVFSGVVYDRTRTRRMMPSPLDAAYAALGNDQAARLLGPELSRYEYAPQLETVRLLADSHERSYWEGSLYTLWLSSLRALSPSSAEIADPRKAGLPQVAATEAWGRRMLNTQLASWAELRHDTLLYAKQSYSASISCDFPDAYVDPYPEFYARLGLYAQRGQEIAAQLGTSYPTASQIGQVQGHFTRLREVLRQLQGMAESQRAGRPFSAEQMAFVNQAVKLQSVGCGTLVADGWYPSLFLDSSRALEFDPTIADVHTQPTDEAGNQVGKVLHVGTGYPRFLIVTADTCHGPRAYVGLVSSYFEKVTDHFQRLNDQDWLATIQENHPADPPWLSDIIVR